MTTKTPREVMSAWFGRGPSSSPDALAGALIGTLAAAGFALHDTRTHVAVPREPTRAMLDAGWNAVGKIAVIYSAMLAAAEEKPDANQAQ